MQGIIKATRWAKSGNSLGVLINDTWYRTKNKELDGRTTLEIIFEPSPQKFDDGGVMYWINDYQEVGASTTPADAAFDAAHAQATQRPVAAPSPRPNSRDKDATIGALALTKAVSGDAATVWGAFEFFYAKLLTWQQGDADFDDQIPF
jgi:hypothetical protein